MVAVKKSATPVASKKKASPKADVSKKRAEQIIASADVVMVVPKGQTIPLSDSPEVIKSEDLVGLREYAVAGTSITLLGMEDPDQTPTLPQIVAMARRLVEVAPKLPRYVKRAAIPAYMFHSKFNPDAIQGGDETGGEGDDEATKPKRVVKMETDTKGSIKVSVIENGVPLKKVCSDIDVDPRIARRILRAKDKRPAGRWEWKPEDVPAIQELLKAEAAKLK